MRDSFNIKTFSHFDAIQKSDWASLTAPHFPFADSAFLSALETSQSVGKNTGWSPLYLTASSGRSLKGASYLYIKEHSYGEYIFDWGWAQAYQRFHIPYYPKLLSAIPFTPATGPRFLFSPDADRNAVAASLIAEALKIAETSEFSSLHYLFIPREEVGFFDKAGFLIRHSFQYHWENQGYESFSGFLETLKTKKRKQILREKEQLKEEKLSFRALTGTELTAEHAQLFYRFYLSTIEKMQAYPYLTEAFFVEVFETMRHEIVLFLAEDKAETVAGSLCYFKGNTLYGRNWGAIREVRNLHFELCYYQPIEWAISRGLKRFEAGAQGEHKVSRGFLPTLTLSAHWIRHPQFRLAIANFIEEEKAAIAEMFKEMRNHSPFKDI